MTVEPVLRLDHEDLKPLYALRGHVRVAAAVALTKTAKDAQAALKDESSHVFHLRNSWVPKGIRIEPATSGTMNAKVGSIDKYMARHVFGARKNPAHSLSIRKQADGHGKLSTGGLLIPSYDGIANSPTHTMTRRRLARIDLQKRKTFQILGRGKAKVLLVRRTTKKRYPLQYLAILSDGVAQHPMWKMDKTVQGVVEAQFGKHFEAAISLGESGGATKRGR